jgi:CTP:molybdopterin cytidylyltransferase MocA
MLITPIIAAGQSQRMGQPKALLAPHDKQCIARVLRACAQGAAGAPVVVLGHEAEAIRKTLPSTARSCMNTDWCRFRTTARCPIRRP